MTKWPLTGSPLGSEALPVQLKQRQVAEPGAESHLWYQLRNFYPSKLAMEHSTITSLDSLSQIRKSLIFSFSFDLENS